MECGTRRSYQETKISISMWDPRAHRWWLRVVPKLNITPAVTRAIPLGHSYTYNSLTTFIKCTAYVRRLRPSQHRHKFSLMRRVLSGVPTL